MYGMNYVIMSNMSTCMSALCRHVTKINHRGEGGGPEPGTYIYIYTRASPWLFFSRQVFLVGECAH